MLMTKEIFLNVYFTQKMDSSCVIGRESTLSAMELENIKLREEVAKLRAQNSKVAIEMKSVSTTLDGVCLAHLLSLER